MITLTHVQPYFILSIFFHQDYRGLRQENIKLKEEKAQLQTTLRNKHVEMSNLYIQFGSNQEEWKELVTKMQEDNQNNADAIQELRQQVRDLQDNQANSNRSIAELREENRKLKLEVKKLECVLIEFDDNQREQRLFCVDLGEIPFEKERLVRAAIMSSLTREEDRKHLMYNLKLENIKEQVSNLQNEEVRARATERIEELPSRIFEEWFISLVEEIKADCRGITRSTLGGFEDTKKRVKKHCKDSKEKCKHMLVMVESLKQLFDHFGLSFGEKDDGLPKTPSRTSKRVIPQEACENQSKRQRKN